MRSVGVQEFLASLEATGYTLINNDGEPTFIYGSGRGASCIDLVYSTNPSVVFNNGFERYIGKNKLSSINSYRA